ncbi:MAG TPA: OmpA family protein [Acetobacteraceae bacterium]|nr:OmpA family protein [Acetobacteraceae bacterium]
MPFTGEVGFGVLGQFGRNPDEFGRYNGFNTNGVDVIGNFDLTGRQPWYSSSTRYYEFWGDNLVYQTGDKLGGGIGPGGLSAGNGFDSSISNHLFNEGSVGFRVGDQGTWGVEGYYNAITYTGNVIDSIYNVNGNTAFLNPGLFPYGGALSQTAATPGAHTSYSNAGLVGTGAVLPVQTGTRRDIVGGNFKYIWNDWTITGAFQHEHKEGTLEESYFVEGSVGGSPFALPVNYDTDRYDVSARYNSRLYQAVVQYTFSHFSDNNLFVALPYPTSGTAKPFQQAAAYSTPPSNSAQYVTVMLATNAIPDTRLNLNARVGVEKQDDTFPPNSADPGIGTFIGTTGFLHLNPMLQGTSEDSPDITATVYQVKVSANNQSIPRTDIDAFYGIDGRSVSLNQYGVYGSGLGLDSAPGSATPYAFVVPQDWLKQSAGADLTYKLIPAYNTRLQLGYRLNVTDYSNAQVGHSWTNTGSIGILSNIGPDFNGKLSFDYSSRSGNLSYLTPWFNLDGPTATPTWSGAYYQAPMTSEAVTLRTDYEPRNDLSADLLLQFKNENYTYPSTTGFGPTPQPLTGVGTGVKQDYALSVGPDINYRPTNKIDIHLFYTYELLFFNNLGNGNCATSNTGSCLGSAGYYQNKDTSSTHTVGVSGEWKVSEKLKLKADYTVSYGSVMFSEFNGVFVTNPTASYQNVTNYPDINSLMNLVRLTASYEVSPGMELILQGVYSSYHETNWYDDASAVQSAGTSAISLLTPGYGSPNWSVGQVMAGMRIKFGAPPPLPPMVAAAVPAAAMQVARSYLVFFDWDKAALTDRARQIIREAADNSTHVKVTRIEVNGYTDTSGTPQYNMGLSIRRADAVKAELIKDGVPANEIATKGLGETHLLVPTGPGVREPQNRRVEIVIL